MMQFRDEMAPLVEFVKTLPIAEARGQGRMNGAEKCKTEINAHQ